MRFDSRGTSIEAWLFLPRAPAADGRTPPLVLMAHGLGGQKDFGLSSYAARFAEAGLAVLAFDYRNFGGSDGEPRNLVSPARHLEDWAEVAAWARSGAPELAGRADAGRLALWGTSLAGGHVLVAAAALDGAVAAVVAQAPHLSGAAAARGTLAQLGPMRAAHLLFLGLADCARGALGLPPLCVPLVGAVGALALMRLPPSEQAKYYAKHPPARAGGWRNAVPARAGGEIARYSPLSYVARVAAPVLFVAGTRDALCPAALVRAAARAAPRGRYLERDAGHFDVYSGALFEDLVGEQVRFLKEALA